MTWHLRNDEHVVNEKRIRRLMRLMGLMPIYQKPNTSKAAKGHKIYPYLLRGLRVDRPNQVWCAPSRDIALQCPVGQWTSRICQCGGAFCIWSRSFARQGYAQHDPERGGLAHTQGAGLAHLEHAGGWLLPLSADCFAIACRAMVDALNEAIHKFGAPDIMNTDQGSQFTSFAWTDRLRRSNVRISMDGKGRFLDNIFVERLWRSLKYECVYLHAWETGSEAKAGVRKWIEFYNHKRPHSALGGKPPAVIYWQRNETTNPDQQVQRVA
jgi:putative transposase